MSNFKKCMLVGTMLMLVSLSVPAAFYKWVDSDGTTHYTQEPPPSGTFQEMHSSALPPASPDTEQTPQESTPDTQENADGQAAAPPPSEQELAKQKVARKQNCDLARQRLVQLQNHPRIRYTAADGSVRVLSEEEKQAKLLETRKMADEMCN